ncbi:NYN domain-containing protein [Desulfoluna sp.]|uniref:NYN domain-containing protein n=1 Tax=Desulfoluna sp. TaxID=2045199 RepID=UPI002625F83D|nr:NYN domain-containing protein [Desulfoluna sp.]
MAETKNIALLIDADNSPAKSIQKIFSELARHGKVNIRRAYGNWTSSYLKGWEAVLQDHAIQPIQQYDLTKGKNATDIAMAIDAMDILYTKQVDTFCIVTSDCDFTPLTTRILSDGKSVIGFGERKTPSVFVNACSTFLFLDEDDEEETKSIKKIKKKELRGDTKLMNLLRDAIVGTENDDGWARLSKVGAHISNHASFDPRNYGYTRLSDLIDAIGLFDLKRDVGMHFEVRDSRKKHTSCEG